MVAADGLDQLRAEHAGRADREGRLLSVQARDEERIRAVHGEVVGGVALAGCRRFADRRDQQAASAVEIDAGPAAGLADGRDLVVVFVPVLPDELRAEHAGRADREGRLFAVQARDFKCIRAVHGEVAGGVALAGRRRLFGLFGRHRRAARVAGALLGELRRGGNAYIVCRVRHQFVPQGVGQRGISAVGSAERPAVEIIAGLGSRGKRAADVRFFVSFP